MDFKKALPTLGLVGLGFGLGLSMPGTLYSYGQTAAGPYRVNRFTGVQQFATDEGWATSEEISRGDEARARRVEASVAPEVAQFGQRLAGMKLAERSGDLRKAEIEGRSVNAYFADGRKETYYAIDLDDPRLDEARQIGERLSARAFAAGATAGGLGQ